MQTFVYISYMYINCVTLYLDNLFESCYQVCPFVFFYKIQNIYYESITCDALSLHKYSISFVLYYDLNDTFSNIGSNMRIH